MMYSMMSALMINNGIKMAEAMKPFIPAKTVDDTPPKMLAHGNWKRITIPMPDNAKQGDEDSRR